ncbi:MAG: hypothetical protein IJQ80_01565 [Clostridia bacterium]|nr:hypothetical protein [Clostridia bacterium]
MKKAYTKPTIVFDSFTVDTCIAACANPSGQHAQGTCGVVDISGFTVFTEDISGCTFPVDDEYNDMCYYVPSGDATLFGS